MTVFMPQDEKRRVPRTVQLPDGVRVGSVPYLNALPLTSALDCILTRLEPRALAQALRDGALDVALVPVMEVLDASSLYRVADGVAIGAKREVYSVYLRHTVPLSEIRSVALDAASKTSTELARIVLERFHNLRPEYRKPGEQADAVLMIGDPAIKYRRAHPEEKYLDLGAEWREHTGMPFVFAVWAMRLPLLKAWFTARGLRTAAKLGRAKRGKLAADDFERIYLREYLSNALGAEQKKSIALFGQMLAENERISAAPKVRYI
jgi:predicted solute-binding protein